MIRKITYLFLFLLLTCDIAYSFIQHLNQPLDGDMAWNIVPDKIVSPILESPLGIDAIANGHHYANPNRFFSHWSMREYFLNVPLYLQKYTDPIDSVYLASAISKILIQLLLVFLIAVASSGTFNILRMDFMVSAVISSCFFQTNGYRSIMGIIDPCPTYNFFYSLPMVFLMILILPLALKYIHNGSYRWTEHWRLIIPLILISLVTCLSGPLNPGAILVICLLVGISQFLNFKKEGSAGVKNFLKKRKLLISVLTPAAIISAYSLFLGTYNIITIDTWIPVSEMYSRLAEGIFYQFFRKAGFSLLFIGITINTFILRKAFKDSEADKFRSLLNWILLFSAVYILLLPLGGFREYRAHILRYDTIMPVTIALIFYYTITTTYLIKEYVSSKKWYITIPMLIFILFSFADERGFEKEDKEKEALRMISLSPENVILLERDMKVLSWGNIEKPEDSELNSQLLVIWNITKEKKWFYNRTSN